MKTHLLTSALSLLGLFFATQIVAQADLAPDQNPNFASSRDKYMRVADSINQWHSTTIHQPFKAYDWYEQRLERHEEDRRFRQALQLEWARNPHNYYVQPYYGRHYNYDSYNRPYYSPYRYHRYHSYHRNYGSSFFFRFCW